MRKSLIVVLIFTFLATSFVPMPPAAASVVLPEPGTMVSLSPAFEPVLIKGLKVHPENPFRFDFIVDTGSPDSLPLVGRAREGDLKEQSSKLIKYFLASLTIPEKDLWVNLSPYEKDRMIADNLGQTQMGQDMLAQDYILKQLTASLIYPEKDLGKAFWDKVYAKAQQMYGTTEIPVNTFNKVWIVADKADVFERGNVAYIVGAHLKVMLEEDYTAFEKNQTPTRGHVAEASASAGDRNVSPSTLPNDAALNMKATQRDAPNALASQIIRDVILPAIEEEINQGKNFAPLRQMFYSMILASWYKMALKDALLTQLYGNQSKMKGLEVFPSPGGRGEGSGTGIDDIYQQYLKAYKKGVFNYIKEDPSTDSGQASTPRKYFSGGVHMGIDHAMQVFKSVLPPGISLTPTGKLALVSGVGLPRMDDSAMTVDVNKVRGIVFDLVGTLLVDGLQKTMETMYSVFEVDSKMLKKWLATGSEAMAWKAGQITLDVYQEHLLRKLGDLQKSSNITEDARKFLNFSKVEQKKLLKQWLLEGFREMPGSKKMLETLRDHGYAVDIFTNTDPEYLVDLKKRFPWLGHLEIMTPADVGKAKPAPEEFLGIFAQKHQLLPEQTLYVDGAYENLTTPRRLRYQALLVNQDRILSDSPEMRGLMLRRIKLRQIKNLSPQEQKRAINILLEEGNIKIIDTQINSPYSWRIAFLGSEKSKSDKNDRRIVRAFLAEFLPEMLAQDRQVPALRVYNTATYELRIDGSLPGRWGPDINEARAMYAGHKEVFITWLKGRLQTLESLPDEAMASSPGGIDFNRAKMRMNINKEGPGVQWQFSAKGGSASGGNPALIDRIRHEGFDGLDFHIERIMPVKDLHLFLGLRSVVLAQ